jgi:hypothetical protein
VGIGTRSEGFHLPTLKKFVAEVVALWDVTQEAQ